MIPHAADEPFPFPRDWRFVAELGRGGFGRVVLLRNPAMAAGDANRRELRERVPAYRREAHDLLHRPSAPEWCDACALGKIKQKPARRADKENADEEKEQTSVGGNVLAFSNPPGPLVSTHSRKLGATCVRIGGSCGGFLQTAMSHRSWRMRRCSLRCWA